MDMIVEQSNLYARQVMGEKYATLGKITREELREYLGFCILMGIAHLQWRIQDLAKGGA